MIALILIAIHSIYEKITLPGIILGTHKGLTLGPRKTQTLGLTRDPPESQFPI